MRANWTMSNNPATYTGVYIDDLFEAFGADASLDVIGANCSDGQKQYYDRDHVASHRPILLLKFDGKPPADWPNSEHGSWLGPYCVVHESFTPTETIYGYVEEPRNAPSVNSISIELTSFTQSLGHFTPKGSASDPEVVKGQKIAEVVVFPVTSSVRQVGVGLTPRGMCSPRPL